MSDKKKKKKEHNYYTKRFAWIFLIMFFPLASLFIGLSVWQVQYFVSATLKVNFYGMWMNGFKETINVYKINGTNIIFCESIPVNFTTNNTVLITSTLFSSGEKILLNTTRKFIENLPVTVWYYNMTIPKLNFTMSKVQELLGVRDYVIPDYFYINDPNLWQVKGY